MRLSLNSQTLLTMLAFISIGLFASKPAFSDVIFADTQGFEVRVEVEVALPAETAYLSLINEVDKWWSSSHTFYGDQKHLSISAAVGGCFCEIKDKSQQTIHLEVTHVDYAKLIRFSGGLGPLQSMPVIGVMDWQLKSVSDDAITSATAGNQPEKQHKTIVSFHYKVSGFVKGGLKNIAAPVSNVLQQQLDSFKQHIETKKAQ